MTGPVPSPAAPSRTPRPDGAEWPAFLRELDSTLAVHSQYILYGNIGDVHLPPVVPAAPGLPAAPATGLPLPLIEMLWERLRPSGYQCLVTFDAVHGIDVFPATPAARAVAEGMLGPGMVGSEPSTERLQDLMAAVCGPRSGDTARPRAAFVVDYAARLVRTPSQLETKERDFFLFCQKLSRTAEVGFGGPANRQSGLYNPLIWLADGERDLPAWLSAGNDRVRSIAIPLPDLPERQRIARAVAANFGVRESDDRSVTRQIEAFAQATDGLTANAMWEVMRLAFDRRLPFTAIGDAVRIFKLGVADNPWAGGHLRDRIRRGEKEVAAKVRGQDQALNKTFDILKRAALGLSGAQASSTGTRPRGIMFFAGPTGTGKTEMAKQIANTLFGRTDAYLRFDMSEFAAEHAADRLIGAPPGYVGFEAGGELTSAVRQQPFRVILFDEIEKAHRGILDKFLQILEDGRLTDGQGTTTYFSECVLIFTSNLGVMKTHPKTGEKLPIVAPGTPYAKVEEKIHEAIRDYFKTELGRPELLNRFGDNIVVFDFISADVAGEIFEIQVENIRQRLLAEHHVELDIAPDVWDDLREHCCADLGNGGRGIGNALESWLINPLARELFALPVMPRRARIEAVGRDEGDLIWLRLTADGGGAR